MTPSACWSAQWMRRRWHLEDAQGVHSAGFTVASGTLRRHHGRAAVQPSPSPATRFAGVLAVDGARACGGCVVRRLILGDGRRRTHIDRSQRFRWSISELGPARVAGTRGAPAGAGLILGSAVSQPCHAFAEPNGADTEGHIRTRGRSSSFTGGASRIPQDLSGHATAPVRERASEGG